MPNFPVYVIWLCHPFGQLLNFSSPASLPNANNQDTFRTSLRSLITHYPEPKARSKIRLTKVLLNDIFSRDLFVLLIDAELRNSEIHGIGLFCREAIPKGTKVWAFNPLFDLVLDESAIWSLPQPAINFMRMYAYRARETRQLIVNVDLSRHMNHSDSPTLVCDPDSNYYTAEDLLPGTELTCDYRVFAVEGCSDFLDRQQQTYSHAAESQIFAVAAEG